MGRFSDGVYKFEVRKIKANQKMFAQTVVPEINSERQILNLPIFLSSETIIFFYFHPRFVTDKIELAIDRTDLPLLLTTPSFVGCLLIVLLLELFRLGF